MMNSRADKSEWALDDKEIELKKAQLEMVKMGETLRKNEEELEELKKRAADIDKRLCGD